MITKAKVVETANGFAVVECERKAACDGCHKNADGKECSICTLLGSNRTVRARAINKIGAKPGDTVSIETVTGRVMFYGLLVFILPIIIAAGAYLVASLFSEGQTICLLSALGGFLLSFVCVWIYSEKVIKNRCDIKITGIFERDMNDD